MTETRPRCFIPPAADAPLAPCRYLDPSVLIEGAPVEGERIVHRSADGRFEIGIWECSPCLERVEDYPYDELMLVLTGAVEITDLDGATRTIRAGDRLVIEKGWSGLWRVTETFRKYYAIHS